MVFVSVPFCLQGLKKDLDDVFVPILEGETSIRDSSVMPSYIFVHMRMSKEMMSYVSELNYVVNFVGADHGGRSRSGQMEVRERRERRERELMSELVGW